MTAELDSLLHVTLSGSRRLELRIPPTADVHPLIVEETTRDAAALAGTLPLLALQFVARLDDAPLDLARADALAADPELMRGVLVHVRTMLETLREKGGVFVLCPGCGRWEPEVSMTAFALTIQAPLPSVFDGPFLILRSLASNLVPGARPPLRRAARVRFELPSAHLRLPAPITGGVLGQIRESPADDAGAAEARSYRRSGPGWRAVRRLARAIDPPVAPEAIEALPAVDLFFLDLVHYITYRAAVPADTPGRLHCPRCGTDFLPVR